MGLTAQRLRGPRQVPPPAPPVPSHEHVRLLEEERYRANLAESRVQNLATELEAKDAEIAELRATLEGIGHQVETQAVVVETAATELEAKDAEIAEPAAVEASSEKKPRHGKRG